MSATTVSTPATERQLATIRRMEQVLRGSRGKKTDTTGMTAQQASDLISDLIREQSAMAEEPEEEVAQAPAEVTQSAPAPEPTPVAQPSVGAQLSQVIVGPPATPKQLETIARMARAQGKTINTDGLTRSQASELISGLIETMQERQPEQGEWPPVPPQLSEAQSQTFSSATTVPAPVVPTPAPVPQAQARATDNPFASDGSDLELATLGDEDDEEADEVSAEREFLAPAAENLGFVIVSVDRILPRSGVVGWSIKAKHIAGGDADRLGGLAEDYISHGSSSRWRMDAFLDAINWPASGSVPRRQLPGKTFWATTERQDDTWTDSATGEERTKPRVRVKSYLQGPPIAVPSQYHGNGTNGAAPTPAKPVARLGAEFS